MALAMPATELLAWEQLEPLLTHSAPTFSLGSTGVEDVSGVSGGNISQLTAEIVDHPVTVDTQQVGDVGGVLRVLRLDVRLGLLANTNKGLGHLSHVHHAGSVLINVYFVPLWYYCM